MSKKPFILAILILLIGITPLLGQPNGPEDRAHSLGTTGGEVQLGVEEEYTIGPGDVLEISVYAGGAATPSHKFEATVRSDGKIFLEVLGEVKVAGLTYRQVEEKIARQMDQYVRNPQVVGHIKEYHNQTILVFGEVSKMGIYPLSRPMRVAEFLAFIGGPTPYADVTKIVISRRDGTILKFDLNRYLFKNDNTQNVLLRDGDKIFVPRKPRSLTTVLRENVDWISTAISIVLVLVTLFK